MYTLRIPLVIVALLGFAFAALAAAGDFASQTRPSYPGEMHGARTRLLTNFDWKFKKGDSKGAEAPSFQDGDWENVNLPHDYSIYGAFEPHQKNGRNNAFRPRGIGWYRKNLEIPEDWKGKQVSIEFDGVYMAPDVWINGHHLGKHLNGYLGFQYDLTPYLNFDGENVVAVRVDNSVPGTSRWYTGSGIYRNVWLTATGPVHVTHWGTYITTPKITDESALVDVKTTVRNTSNASEACSLVTEILDNDGKIVAHQESPKTVEAGAELTFHQEINVPKPHLWSPESPYLYKAISYVKDASGTQDRYETPFGIRIIKMTPDQGLLVNGKKVVAKGVNLHHDLGCLGTAAFERGFERRLQTLKEMGCNAIRMSHNPHAPVLLDLCDRMGFLVFDEAYDKWMPQYYGKMATFEEMWPRDLEAFLRRDRNHPSVFIWSVGNEVGQQGKEPDYGVNQLKKMVDFVHEHEPSRKVTAALYPRRAKGVAKRTVKGKPVTKEGEKAFRESEPAEMAFEMDVVSANYQGAYFAKDHKKYPGMIFIESETTVGDGAGAWFNFDKEYVVGQFYWGGIDYLGEARHWPNIGWFRGLIDTCGFRKPISYYTQSTWSDEPMVHIAIQGDQKDTKIVWNDVELVTKDMVSHWNWPHRKKVKLVTYTNCDAVKLFLNGRPLGEKKLADADRMLIEWSVPYEPGIIEAVGEKDGKVVARHELKTAGAPERIVLQPDRAEIKANGLDLSHIKVLVVDKDGVTVPTAGQDIHFTVEGEGTNAGVDNGNLFTDELYQADHRPAYQGKALLVVRSTRKPGKITVTATAEGLKPAALQLQSH